MRKEPWNRSSAALAGDARTQVSRRSRTESTTGAGDLLPALAVTFLAAPPALWLLRCLLFKLTQAGRAG